MGGKVVLASKMASRNAEEFLANPVFSRELGEVVERLTEANGFMAVVEFEEFLRVVG